MGIYRYVLHVSICSCAVNIIIKPCRFASIPINPSNRDHNLLKKKNIKEMKLLFACSLLVASILLIEAVPSSQQLYKKVIQTVEAAKRSDFKWEDCSKSDIH